MTSETLSAVPRGFDGIAQVMMVDSAVIENKTEREKLEAQVPLMQGVVVKAARGVAEAFQTQSPLPPGTTKKDAGALFMLDIADNAAGDAMISGFKVLPYGYKVRGEGEDDMRLYGQDVTLVEGKLGNGPTTFSVITDALDNSNITITYVKDLKPDDKVLLNANPEEIEKYENDSAIAVAALAELGNIRNLDIGYWQSAIGPDIEGVSLEKQSPREIIRNWVAYYEINGEFKTPEDKKRFILTTLNREANKEIIEAAEDEGITLVQLMGGTVLPVVKAGENPDGTIGAVFTRGKGPELEISAAIAKAKGGVMVQARQWYEDRDALEASEVFELNDIIFGDSIVAIAHVTDDKLYTGRKGVPLFTEYRGVNPPRIEEPVETTTIAFGEVTYGIS